MLKLHLANLAMLKILFWLKCHHYKIDQCSTSVMWTLPSKVDRDLYNSTSACKISSPAVASPTSSSSQPMSPIRNGLGCSAVYLEEVTSGVVGLSVVVPCVLGGVPYTSLDGSSTNGLSCIRSDMYCMMVAQTCVLNASNVNLLRKATNGTLGAIQ